MLFDLNVCALGFDGYALKVTGYCMKPCKFDWDNFQTWRTSDVSAVANGGMEGSKE